MKQPSHRSCLDELAGVHHSDAVAGLGDDSEIVGDEDNRGSRLRPEIAQEIENARGNRDIKSGRRFVSNEKLRRCRQRHRDHHPLTHPSGQLMSVLSHAPRRIVDADEVEQFERSSLRVGVRPAFMDLDKPGDLSPD